MPDPLRRTDSEPTPEAVDAAVRAFNEWPADHPVERRDRRWHDLRRSLIAAYTVELEVNGLRNIMEPFAPHAEARERDGIDRIIYSDVFWCEHRWPSERRPYGVEQCSRCGEQRKGPGGPDA